MMKKFKYTLLFACFLMTAVICGCGRSGEIRYFDREAAGDRYDPDRAESMDGLSREVLTEGEQDLQKSPQDTPKEDTVEICVHVCGQVLRPGVVMLPEGSRAWEAVEAAGGLTDEARDAAVNLAAVLQDGEKLYIPAMDEDIEENGDGADSGPVNLNTADAARLQTLPGIGESRAADILSYRERHGSFQSAEEIMQVPGIKENTFEKIRDKIIVD